ncbi:MAG: ATP-binding protein [Solirubrobacteraceae bacterium]
MTDSAEQPSGRAASAEAVRADEGARLQRELERARSDLEATQRLAKIGSWSWDPASGEATWSGQLYELFGRDPARGPATGAQLLDYVHAEDLDGVVAARAQACAGEPELELELRIVADDGVERPLRVIGRANPARAGSYAGTVEDVGERRRAHLERIELLDASARADSANRAKSELLAQMSHELRTPLNTIIGFGQLLELDPLGPRERDHVRLLLQAARQMLEQVDEVLDVANIEAGRIKVATEPVAVADAIRYVLTLLAPRARELEIRLSFDPSGPHEDAHVQGDRNRLNQVLLNLLSNAIKYNRRGGRVDVSYALTDPGRVRIAIADTGIGIQADLLATAFEPFARLGAELTEVEGTGLGLTLSKGLVEAMGGTIEISSRRGVGTTITVELAAVAPRREQQPLPTGDSLPELGDPAGQRWRILYIEDNVANLTLVQRILERYPAVELIPAMQATIGLELAREHLPDLIVLDLHLPDMPGPEALKRLREEHPDVPVVVLTADATDEMESCARQLGAADYLTKPLDVPRFVNALAANLNAGDRPL